MRFWNGSSSNVDAPWGLNELVRLEDLADSLTDSKCLKIGLGIEVRQFGLEKISMKQLSSFIHKFFFQK